MELTTGDKQRKFTKMVAQLILWAYDREYQLTFGDAWAKTGHMANSLHYIRLAIDLNLFKDGVWLTDAASFAPLHDYWESIGGSLRIEKDSNHFSLEHEGRR